MHEKIHAYTKEQGFDKLAATLPFLSLQEHGF